MLFIMTLTLDYGQLTMTVIKKITMEIISLYIERSVLKSNKCNLKGDYENALFFMVM